MTAYRRNPLDADSAVERLRAVAGPSLASWIALNRGHVRREIEDALSEGEHREAERSSREREQARAAASPGARQVAAAPVVRGAGQVSFEGAVAWARQAAEELVANTHFDQKGMVPDAQGASVSTYGALRSYAGIPAPLLDATPLEVHLSALRALALHTGAKGTDRGQIDKNEWRAAYAAVQHRYEQERPSQPPPPETAPARIYDASRSARSGLDDGTHYQIDDKGEVSLGFPAYKRGGPQVNDLLKAAGFEKYRDFRWEKRRSDDGRETWWLVTDPSRVERLADAVAEHYPALAAALRQNAPIWRAATERSGASRGGPTREAPAPVPDLSTLDPERGSVPGMKWEWKPGTFDVHLLFERNAKALLAGGGVAFTWATRDRRTGEPAVRGVTPPEQTEWWVKVPTTQLEALARATTSLPAAHAAVLALSPAWGATRSVLKQSREEGVTEEGSWRTLPNGTVQLYTVYKASAQGWQRGAIGAVVKMAKDAQGKWYFSFNEKRAVMVATALREHYPRLAEALARSFGGVARTIDEEAAKCDPLVDMSGAKAPGLVKHPIGQAVIEDVVRALKVRLPHGLALRPFQVVGIAFAKLAGYRALIGDAMGLGKTVQALGCLAVDPEELLPAVVVCPAAVFYNWQAEAKRWLPTVPVHPLATGRTPLPPPGWKGIILVTWNQLVTHAPALEKWGMKCIIGDEAHKMKEPQTSWSKAMVALSQAVPHILLLTGTPVKNRVIELHNLLLAIDPESYGSKSEFGREYTNVETFRVGGKQVTKYEGGKNLEALNARLRCVMVRRLKEDVLDELPPKQRVFLPVEIPAPARAEYERAKDEFASWLEGALERKIAAQYEADGIDPADATAEIRETVAKRAERALRAEQLVKIGYLRRMVGIAKIEPAVEQIVSFVESGEPLVVFTEHQEVVKNVQAGLRKAGVRFVTVDGSASLADREKAKHAFQNGQVDVFIGTQAAKEGITLTRASNTVFVERWWTPGDEEQAEDRIHRIGQRNAATIWFLHAEDTIDDHLRALIEAKRSVAKRAVGGTTVFATTHSLDDVIDALGSGGIAALAAAIAGKEGRPRPSASALKSNPRLASAGVPPLPPRTALHALLFLRGTWNATTVAHWTRMHGFARADVERAARYLRVRQQDASRFVPGSFRTVALTDTISAIVGLPR